MYKFLSAYLSVYYVQVWGLWRPEKTSDLLEVELQVIMGYHVNVESTTRSVGRTAYVCH